MAQRLDADTDEIRRAGVTHGVERHRRRTNQRGNADGGERGVEDAAARKTRGRGKPCSRALGYPTREHVDDIRTRRYREERRCGDEKSYVRHK